MSSFAWGADAPMINEQDLRRLARHLRSALAALVEEQSGGGGRGRGGPSERVDGTATPADRAGESEERGHGPCAPGAHHHRGPRPDFTDEAAREAWREQRRAWRRAMAAAAEEAPDREDRRTRPDDSRSTGAKGERGGKGKHRQRREDSAEAGPERGGPRRRGPDAGDPGGFGWGPGRPFAPFGPFGPGAGGPGRGFRGRGPGWRFEGGRGRAGRGDVRLAILALLSEGPRHGYQLIQDITERSEGAWAPSPGSIYPALSSLQDEGLIDDEKVEGRRVFSLTDAGRAYVAARQDQIDAVFALNSPTSEHEALAEVGVLMWGVGEAALTVLGTGTESQRAEARDLLARTRRDLFRILAEDTVPATDMGSPADRADSEPSAAAAEAPEPGEPAEGPDAGDPSEDPAS